MTCSIQVAFHPIESHGQLFCIEWAPGQPWYHGNMLMVGPLDRIINSQGLGISTPTDRIRTSQWLGIRTPLKGGRGLPDLKAWGLGD